MAKKIMKLRTPDLVWLCDVTHMTLLNWRKGSVRKTRPLPYDIGPGGEVTFSATALRKWAKENGLELRKDPVAYLADLNAGVNPRKRPGPKPKVDVDERTKTERARDVARIESKHAARKDPEPPTVEPKPKAAPTARKRSKSVTERRREAFFRVAAKTHAT